MKKERYLIGFLLLLLPLSFLSIARVYSSISGDGFKIYFTNGSSLGFQHLGFYLTEGFTASVTVQSGILNGSNAKLRMETDNGELAFTSHDTAILVPSESMTIEVNGEIYDKECSIQNGDSVRFVWGSLMAEKMISGGVELAIGGTGLALTILSPIYLIKKVKKKDAEEMIMGIFLGMMAFLIGFALIVAWLGM